MRQSSADPPRVAKAALTLLAMSFAGACNKTEPEGHEEPRQEKPAAVVEDTSFRRPAAERIVAIGDLHGDVKATRAALRLAGAIDDHDEWVGGRLVVVQTGDELDRGDDEPEIMDLLERSAMEAKAAGGAVLALNGNHEVMNVAGDFRYVTEDGFHDFSGEHAGPHEQEILALPADERGRARAFLPGGRAAKRLAEHSVVVQVGDTVFVHGGILEAHVRYGLGRINTEVSRWMQSETSEPAPPRAVAGDAAPIWTRDYSDGDPTARACEELSRVLAALGAKRMVVGHTVQKQGINSACDAKVWRIDVGLSRFYGAAPSVLEITGGEVRVLQGTAPAAAASGKAPPSSPR